jgi:uncharacterized protein YbjT (DUF2867 family)
VRAVTVTGKKRASFTAKRSKAAPADLSDLDSLRRAFAGVDAAFLHLPFVGNDVSEIPKQLGNALRAAKETDLPRLVFTTSGSTMDNLPPVAMVEANRAAASGFIEQVPKRRFAPDDLSRKSAAFLPRRNEESRAF